MVSDLALGMCLKEKTRVHITCFSPYKCCERSGKMSRGGGVGSVCRASCPAPGCGVLFCVLLSPSSPFSLARLMLCALSQGQTVDDIPKEVLIDCAHLVKANSIQGGSASHWGWEQGVCCGCFCSTRACV